MFFCYTYVVPFNGLALPRVLCRSVVEREIGRLNDRFSKLEIQKLSLSRARITYDHCGVDTF